MTRERNPFERYDIDPMGGPEAITLRLRELVDEADDDEREALRAIWEELTMHPRRRLKVALDAFPETRAALGDPPAPPPRHRHDPSPELRLCDLALLPSVAGALSPTGPDEPPAILPPLSGDPNLDDTP